MRLLFKLKPAMANIRRQTSNYNAISQFLNLPCFDLGILSVNQTQNRDSGTPGFEASRALQEIDNAVFQAFNSGSRILDLPLPVVPLS
jgi:hypothetical protein